MREQHVVIPNRIALPTLITRPAPRVIEVGVARGAYTRQYIPRLPADSEIYLLDRWRTRGRVGLDDRYRVVQKLFGATKNVHIVVGESPAAAAQFEDDFFDWIYIDADHRYASVLADLQAFWPKLRMSGIFSGHDYFKHKDFGVIQAVNEFFGQIPVRITHEAPPDPGHPGQRPPSWWVRKTPDVVKSLSG
jgi:hypothetical protein